MKNGITPIGLTMASSAISGFRRSMRQLWPECVSSLPRAFCNLPQIAQARHRTCAVPAEHLAVDETRARVRAQRLRFVEMRLAEGVRLGAEQHLIDLREPHFVAAHDRIARRTAGAAVERRQGLPVHAAEHAG